MNKPFNGLLALFLLILTACAGAGAPRDAVSGNADTQIVKTHERGKAGNVFTQEEVLYRLMLAEIAGQRGLLDVSIENLLSVSAQVNDPRVAERAARVAIYAQDYPAALRAAKRWVQLAPENMEANQVLAALALRLGDADEAVAAFRHVLQAEPQNSEQAFLLIAGLLGGEGSEYRETAMAIMGRLIEDYPENAYASFAYGNLAILLGEFEIAERQLMRAYRLDPKLSQALTLHARTLKELGRVDEAIAELAAAVKNEPENDELRLAYARVLIDAKRYQEAKVQIKRLLDRSPDDADLVYTLGLLALDMDQLDESVDYLQRLLALGERQSEAYYYLGRIAEVRKRDEQAVEHYRRVAEATSYRLDAEIRIARLLGDMGRLDDARNHLQKLRIQNRDPATQVQFYIAEAEVLSGAGLYQQATELLSKALHDYPGDTDLLYSRALIYEKQDRIDLTESDLRAVLLREPENADVLNALGYTLADRTDRYREAYELIRQAMKLKPNNPAITDSMGWVLYRLGRHEEAVEHLRKALELQYDAEIAAHLGEVLWVTGDHQAARAVVKQALEKTPEDENLLKINQQLRSGRLPARR
ncbi:MAG TPA: tetratricopeptide repeat protein [Gammaproteobacteria bacterium]